MNAGQVTQAKAHDFGRLTMRWSRARPHDRLRRDRPSHFDPLPPFVSKGSGRTQLFRALLHATKADVLSKDRIDKLIDALVDALQDWAVLRFD